MAPQLASLASPGVQTPPSLVEIIERVRRGKRRRWLAIGLLAALLPVLGVALWLSLRPKPMPLVARFRSASVSRGDVVREVQATGRLEAVTTVQVGAEISGKIASVEVDYNDHVTAGQVLARFDRAALSAAAATHVSVTGDRKPRSVSSHSSCTTCRPDISASGMPPPGSNH